MTETETECLSTGGATSLLTFLTPSTLFSLYIFRLMTSNDFQVLCVQSSYNQPITTAFTFLIFNTSTTSALLPSMMLLLLALTTFRRHFNADFLSIISWGIMCSVELQLSAAWIRNRVDVDIRSPRTKTISLLFITSALRYHFQIPKGRQKLQTHMKCRVKVI